MKAHCCCWIPPPLDRTAPQHTSLPPVLTVPPKAHQSVTMNLEPRSSPQHAPLCQTTKAPHCSNRIYSLQIHDFLSSGVPSAAPAHASALPFAGAFAGDFAGAFAADFAGALAGPFAAAFPAVLLAGLALVCALADSLALDVTLALALAFFSSLSFCYNRKKKKHNH